MIILYIFLAVFYCHTKLCQTKRLRIVVCGTKIGVMKVFRSILIENSDRQAFLLLSLGTLFFGLSLGTQSVMIFAQQWDILRSI